MESGGLYERRPTRSPASTSSCHVMSRGGSSWRWIAEKPALFNEWSRRSLKFYGDTFSNADEPFHPPRPELPAPRT